MVVELVILMFVRLKGGTRRCSRAGGYDGCAARGGSESLRHVDRPCVDHKSRARTGNAISCPGTTLMIHSLQ